MEGLELQKFYKNLQVDISSNQLATEEGASQEQLFTSLAIDLLVEAGETENVKLAYDEKILKSGVQHKINAYSLSENLETLDLIITVYNGTDEISVVNKDSIERAQKRITSFFKTSIYKDYSREIEESSEIFDLANTLGTSLEVREGLSRINAIILTDGKFNSEISSKLEVSGYPIYYRVIDLNYLFNISEKSHIPIEIDFQSDGFQIPCIAAPKQNDQYESYLAIFPGDALANIYEKYGARLLEQNVRSFLQFSGKINKGIRNTILKEPHMFLAFNNGITATADKIELNASNNQISKVYDFQIVNGGQTTASIFHTWKKDKANISNIHVQVKLSVVKEKDNFSEIVSRIAEYANTQNKVTISDLSSNQPFHIEIEKFSRSIWAAPIEGQNHQTRWFYERARGQYKNARQKEGFTKAKQTAFDLKNPKNQLFNKEELAKFINAYSEVFEGRKFVIGPHFVVRGNQKNYAQFMSVNLPKTIDSLFFEDLIAKMILYKSIEKVYGIKPNSIGDMRYITVPYSISYFNYKTKNKLDLYKIWKAQRISDSLKSCFFNLMVQVEAFIKSRATGSLYGEFAKKEECWTILKESNLNIDLNYIKEELESSSNPKRKRVTIDEALQTEISDSLELLRSVHPGIWKKIEEWGKETEKLTLHQRNLAYTISGIVKNKRSFTDLERENGLKILEFAADEVPEIFFDMDELITADETMPKEKLDISLEDLRKLVDWDKKNKRLQVYEFKLMNEILKGEKELTDRNIFFASKNIEKAKKWGYDPE